MRRIDERGETLVEVIMALAVLSLVLVSSYALATSTFRLGRGAGQRTQAVNYLQQQAEALRSYRNNTTWSEFVAKTSIYDGNLGGVDNTFCMVADAAGIWAPKRSGDTGDCTVDGIVIKITAAAVLDPGHSPSGQYSYGIAATWDESGKKSSTQIQTVLTDQTRPGATP